LSRSLPDLHGHALEHVPVSALPGPVFAGPPEPTLIVTYTKAKLTPSSISFNSGLYAPRAERQSGVQISVLAQHARESQHDDGGKRCAGYDVETVQ